MYSFVGVIMKKKNVFRKLVVGIMLTSAVMLAGCSSKEVTTTKEADKETTTVKKVVEKETTTKGVEEETTVKEATTEFNPDVYKFKGTKFLVTDELLANEITGRKITDGETVFANDFMGEKGDILVGNFIYNLLKAMNLDFATFAAEHDDGRGTIVLIPDENYSFVNTTGKEYYFEYVGSYDMYYCFDLYTVE